MIKSGVDIHDDLLKIAEALMRMSSYLEGSKFNYNMGDYMRENMLSVFAISNTPHFTFSTNLKTLPDRILITSKHISSEIITNNFQSESIDEKIEFILKYHDKRAENEEKLKKTIKEYAKSNREKFGIGEHGNAIRKIDLDSIKLTLNEDEILKTTSTGYINISIYSRNPCDKKSSIPFKGIFSFNPEKNEFEINPEKDLFHRNGKLFSEKDLLGTQCYIVS